MPLVVKNLPAKAGDMRCGFDPWVGKIPGGRNGYPLRYSCLENPVDRGVWWLQHNALYPLCIAFDILKTISTEMNSILKKLALGICRGDLNLGHQEVAECRGAVLVAQSCPALCDPMDCSPPGSSVHGVLQAAILEWVSMPFSRGSS